MASMQEVRQYLAHWFQVGKGINLSNGQIVRIKHVSHDMNYTDEFENCWQQILAEPDCYLEGTEQTIADLLSFRWDLVSCSRCTMPIPLPAVGLPPISNCTCIDLPSWPNISVPLPGSPEKISTRTNDLRQRLATIKNP